jgi:vancomycin resistance protein YoaR
VVHVDRAKVRRAVVDADPTGRRDAVEPGITGDDDGQIAVVLGQDGKGLDADAIGDMIVEAAALGSRRLDLTVEAVALHPRFTRGDAEALASKARTLVTSSVEVRAGDITTVVPAATLRSWLSSSATRDSLELALDEDETIDDLAERLEDAGTEPADARFTVEGGHPSILAGVDGTECCDARAVGLVLDAIEKRADESVQLPLRSVEPKTTTKDLEALRVVEEIGSFTTHHKCCENRVQNIHRIADLVRGVVIDPGDTFSVNQHVGKRTTENGFVVDHVIENGSFAEAVGGGISQFATTTFNAAFFGGLELKAYQSHSIYISRYPYGREATLSFPEPDLVIGNSTPYGVLIWPTYTGTSLTVTLYSTTYAHGEQTAQSQAPTGPNGCVRVTTERTRTYVDGTTKTDKVYAVYRPSEGVQCR